MRVNSLADQQSAEVAQAGPHAAPTNFLAAFHSPTTQSSNGFHPSPPTAAYHGTYPQAGPVAWRNFASSMMTNVGGGHDYTGKPPDIIEAQMGSMQIPASGGGAHQLPWGRSLLHYGGGGGGSGGSGAGAGAGGGSDGQG